MKRHLLARQARGAAAPLAAGLLATTLLAVAAGPASARAGTLPAPSRATAGWLAHSPEPGSIETDGLVL